MVGAQARCASWDVCDVNVLVLTQGFRGGNLDGSEVRMRAAQDVERDGGMNDIESDPISD